VNTPRPGWKDLVRQAVERLPATFSLADILGHRDFFKSHSPNNRFIDAKIRQSLQIRLRCTGGASFVRLDYPKRNCQKTMFELVKMLYALFPGFHPAKG
jgi:hypothetical protein